MRYRLTALLFLIVSLAVQTACKVDDPDTGTIQLIGIKAGNTQLNLSQTTGNIALNSVFSIGFGATLDTASARKNISIKIIPCNSVVACNYSFADANKTTVLTPVSPLDPTTNYAIVIGSGVKGGNKESFPGFEVKFLTEVGRIVLQSITLNGANFSTPNELRNISYNQIEFRIRFSEKIRPANLQSYFSIFPTVAFSTSLSADQQTVTITNSGNLDYYRKYSFYISPDLVAENGFTFDGFYNIFYTGLNPTLKFPLLSDEALMTLVQERTFRYFWDFAHPVSGLARERKGSGETVTIGGSGFGLQAILVGIHRGFITRTEGVERINKIVNFLTTADRFHGVWPHWMNGTTGKTIPFSSKDNGGDLVETSFMAAAMLCVRQYLNPANSFEAALAEKINSLLQQIEWSWYTRGGQNVLYWHWSPNYGWDMNMQVRGYNEALITYFMAATSTTYPISATVYHQGWAGTSYFINGRSFYGLTLPLGWDYGGPLFFAHYSFLGLNPTNLRDQYGNYWTQNVNHSLIHQRYCTANPKNYTGYSADCWGLTASDDPSGYTVHEPSRDNGTISPTAALSSFPFSPQESLKAMRHFYYVLGDKLWGEYGFYDAFNPHQGWWASSYLAIDQGPIIIGIENYRSGLCWNLFMSAPEVQMAMTKLGFYNQ